MRRRSLLLCGASLLVPLGGYGAYKTWFPDDVVAIPTDTVATPAGRSRALAQIRRSCKVADLDAFVARQRELVTEQPGPEHQRVLAEALLERIATRITHRGMKVGAVLFDEIPEPIANDIDEGLQLLERARKAGDDSSDNHRIQAALLCYRITGWASALEWSGEIGKRLQRALELDEHNARAHVALGCRKLFSPALLGQDLDKAREHLDYGARALPLDERPLIFAAMAAHLGGQRDQSLALLRQAIERNPGNPYAVEVARRLDEGEADPFGRDIE